MLLGGHWSLVSGHWSVPAVSLRTFGGSADCLSVYFGEVSAGCPACVLWEVSVGCMSVYFGEVSAGCLACVLWGGQQ